MSWTEITRRQYRREGLRYASDLTETEWALIAPLLPGPSRVGRPRTADLRKVVEAILYMASSGCQWRALPKDFPPYSTVQGYFYDWSRTKRWGRSWLASSEMLRGAPSKAISAERSDMGHIWQVTLTT